MRAIVEALVFAAPQPLTAREIGRVLQGVPKEAWQQALEELKRDYARDERGLQLIEVASGWQITTRPEYNDWVRELLDPKTPTRLSIQALETLSVIAYRQPVTLPEIIELRGVRSQGVVKTLLEKRLIRITGRKEVVGRPMLYGTTKQFLLHFGLKDLEELPQIEEFAEVLGEEVDVPGLKKAIEAPRPAEVPLSEDDEAEQGTLFDESGEGEDVEDENAGDEPGDDEEADGRGWERSRTRRRRGRRGGRRRGRRRRGRGRGRRRRGRGREAMKIRDIRATPVSVPLQAPLRHANGCHWGRFVRTIVEVETEDGLVGLGEMGGGGEAATAAFEGLRPSLMGRDPARLEEMRFLLANPTASLYNNRTQLVAALEFACLDLLGQRWGVPVSEILGGRLRERVPFASYLFFRYPHPTQRPRARSGPPTSWWPRPGTSRSATASRPTS